MTINFLIVLVIIALAAWLGNVMMAVEAEIAQARSRIRSAKDSVQKLESALKRLKRDEERLNQEIEKLAVDIEASRQRQSEVQKKLVEEQGRRRPRLLILSDRRNGSDKEWLVVVANTQIGEIDTHHPLAMEWAKGRDFLVWAENEKEAAERASRRFGARPGFSIKSVTPISPEELFPTPKPASAR